MIDQNIDAKNNSKILMNKIITNFSKRCIWFLAKVLACSIAFSIMWNSSISDDFGISKLSIASSFTIIFWIMLIVEMIMLRLAMINNYLKEMWIDIVYVKYYSHASAILIEKIFNQIPTNIDSVSDDLKPVEDIDIKL